jgi:hypothetical protein
VPEELPPPLVTISDPRRPGVPTDVVAGGHDRDPWRPSRRQLQVLTAVVVTGALVAGTSAHVQQRRREQARDRAALAAADVALTTSFQEDREPPAGTVTVGVRNDGPTALRVLSLRFGDPAYQDVRLDLDLPRYAIKPVDVPFATTCPQQPPRSAPKQGTVRIHGPGGGERDIVVTLLGDVRATLLGGLQEACGLFPPEDSVGLQADQPVTRGRVTTVTIQATVRGVQPVVLTALDPPPGFAATVSPALPLQLPAGTLTGPPSTTPLTVTLTVTDCEQAVGQRVDDGFVPFADVHVRSLDGRDRGTVPLLLFDQGTDLANDALGDCPRPGDGGG